MLAVINIKESRVEYYDSLRGEDRKCLANLKLYIKHEAMNKRKKVLDIARWNEAYYKAIPRQMNGCDCGVFMLKYADFISSGVPLSAFGEVHSVTWFTRINATRICFEESTEGYVYFFGSGATRCPIAH